MRQAILFVTGTDTGVGKTILAAALTRRLRERGVRVAALKPVCAGGRGDARLLRRALGGALALHDVNPWFFRAPLAPLLAARREQERVMLADVLAHVRSVRRRFDVTLIEGAGGLLSPLGEDFCARDLIKALRALPVIVCPNRLGAVNQALLVIAALPPKAAKQAHIVLMSPRRADAASRTNAKLLAEFLGPERVHAFPWLADAKRAALAPASSRVRRVLDALQNVR